MSKDEKHFVAQVRGALQARIGAERYALWFGDETRLGWDGRRLLVQASTRFRLDRIRAAHRADLEEVLQALLGNRPELDYGVDTTLAEAGARLSCHSGGNGASAQRRGGCLSAPGDAPVVAGSSPPDRNDAETTTEVPFNAVSPIAVPSIAVPSTAVPSTAVPSTAVPPTATPPASSRLSSRRTMTLEAYVVGESNRVAAASVRRVVQQPGCVSPLVLHGPPGVGKSHLLEAALHGVRRAWPERRCLLLSAEQFTAHFQQALRGGGMPSFRQKYRGLDLFLLDDVQFMGGKSATLGELLHTIDNLQRSGRQVVLTSDRSPDELADLGREFSARVASGLTCELRPADEATRRGILRDYAARQPVTTANGVLDLLAERLPGDARRLQGAVNRLVAFGLATGESITAELAHEALSDLLRGGAPLVRLPDIERVVCRAFGISAEELHSGSKAKQVSHPRMVAMWLARKLTPAGLTEIGSYFGRRSHSTVVAAQKKIDTWRESDTQLRLSDRTCQVSEALRRLESQLQGPG